MDLSCRFCPVDAVTVFPCRAELSITRFSYQIDSGDNTFHDSGIALTGSNGFFTINVTTNKSYQIHIYTTINNTEYEGYTQFGTYSDSANCITTARLAILSI